ncbi:phosphatidyl serine synthase-domain-containing protein [Chytriomyces sp. MP71]|nr:phosphatidyl serine synthase-domain-containing protein [Chytriomyces sp. MP71]
MKRFQCEARLWGSPRTGGEWFECWTYTPLSQPARDAWLYHYADDIKPSLDFFYKPHTLSVLLFLISGLIYYAFNANNDVVANTKAGAVACFGVILITGLLQFRDGPFIRPHPAFWRLVLALSVSYQLILVMILFQDKHTARHLFTYLDPSLGVPLPEKNYANDCTITWQTVYDQMDVFVVAHTVGWFAKSMVLRDEWICWILSILFEFLEYSLQHQLPNFAECWWDHWVLDVLVTNWLGIYLGMKTCEFFACRQYSWRSINQIESYQGKIQRGFEQFTPHSWTRFAWGPSKTIWNFLAVIALIVFELTIELNAFYLKALLWLPPPHFINVLRLFIMFLFCMPATREVYQYLSDPRCKRLGYHAWMLVANVATEALICVKFSEGEFTEPFPRNVIYFWMALVVALIVYAAAQFGLRPLLQAQTEEAARVKAD